MPWVRRSAARKEVVASLVEQQRRWFDDAVLIREVHGESLTPAQKEFVKEQRKSFDELLATVRADAAADLDRLEGRAQELGNKRAYILAAVEMEMEVKQVLEDLRGWNIPPEDLANVEALAAQRIARKDATVGRVPGIDPGRGSRCVDTGGGQTEEPPTERDGAAGKAEPYRPNEAQAALCKILADFDFWSNYVDWFNKVTVSALMVLGFLALTIGPPVAAATPDGVSAPRCAGSGRPMRTARTRAEGRLARPAGRSTAR